MGVNGREEGRVGGRGRWGAEGGYTIHQSKKIAIVHSLKYRNCYILLVRLIDGC